MSEQQQPQQQSPRRARRDEDVNRITGFFGSSRGGLIVIVGLVVILGFGVLTLVLGW